MEAFTTGQENLLDNDELILTMINIHSCQKLNNGYYKPSENFPKMFVSIRCCFGGEKFTSKTIGIRFWEVYPTRVDTTALERIEYLSVR